MKKILLAVVLGVAVVAGAQDTAQPAQGQPATQSQPGQQPAQPAAAQPAASSQPAQSSAQPAQPAAQPAQGQAAAPSQAAQPSAQPAPQAEKPAQPAAAPVIKDPAEYNAYVNAIQQSDPNAKISALEAFVTQYPNSIMKNQALEILMGTYQ